MTTVPPPPGTCACCWKDWVGSVLRPKALACEHLPLEHFPHSLRLRLPAFAAAVFLLSIASKMFPEPISSEKPFLFLVLHPFAFRPKTLFFLVVAVLFFGGLRGQHNWRNRPCCVTYLKETKLADFGPPARDPFPHSPTVAGAGSLAPAVCRSILTAARRDERRSRYSECCPRRRASRTLSCRLRTYWSMHVPSPANLPNSC